MTASRRSWPDWPGRYGNIFPKPLEKLPDDPFVLDLKALRGRTDWHLRVGAWRILLRMDADEKVIVVHDMGPRGDIYK